MKFLITIIAVFVGVKVLCDSYNLIGIPQATGWSMFK